MWPPVTSSKFWVGHIFVMDHNFSTPVSGIHFTCKSTHKDCTAAVWNLCLGQNGRPITSPKFWVCHIPIMDAKFYTPISGIHLTCKSEERDSVDIILDICLRQNGWPVTSSKFWVGHISIMDRNFKSPISGTHLTSKSTRKDCIDIVWNLCLLQNGRPMTSSKFWILPYICKGWKIFISNFWNSFDIFKRTKR